MNRRAQAIQHLERSGEDSRRRRALAARLDTTLNRAGMSSDSVARLLNVDKHYVQFWRRGITVPSLNVFTHIAAFLDVDLFWLCTGQTSEVPAF